MGIFNSESYESSCPSCVGVAPWTYERFIRRTFQIHGDKFDYSKASPSDVLITTSIIILICNKCKYEWKTTINSHVNKRTGCPSYSRRLKWTYERFICAVKETHRDKFNYSKVTPEQICGKESRAPLICNKCEYEWKSSITNHINMNVLFRKQMNLIMVNLIIQKLCQIIFIIRNLATTTAKLL